MHILRVLTLLVLVSNTLADSKCPHDQGLYCPNIEAPRVTELREGAVKIKYLIEKNGSVSEVEVIESSGDPRWVEVVTRTVMTWKYRESNKAYEQEFEFNAVFGP